MTAKLMSRTRAEILVRGGTIRLKTAYRLRARAINWENRLIHLVQCDETGREKVLLTLHRKEATELGTLLIRNGR